MTDAVIAATDFDTRKPVYLRVAQIAGFLELKPDGPARVLFSGGGHLDICGGARIWMLQARIEEIKARMSVDDRDDLDKENPAAAGTGQG